MIGISSNKLVIIDQFLYKHKLDYITVVVLLLNSKCKILILYIIENK